MKYQKKATMFGDMAKGGHLQTYRVYCDGETTPIFQTNIKKDRDSPWTETVTWDADGKGGEYQSIKEAIDAWEAAGKPGMGNQ